MCDGRVSKINKKLLKLSKQNVKKLAADDNDLDEDIEDNEESEVSSLSPESFDEQWSIPPFMHLNRKGMQKVYEVSQNGLEQQRTKPTKAQLVARKGLTYKLLKFSGNPA